MDNLQLLITSIPHKMEGINEILQKGPSISYFNAINLGKKSNDVCSTINKAIAVYEQGFTPSGPEAQSLLEAMTKVVDMTEGQLSLLVDTKPVFDKLWVAGLVKKDTASLRIASANLSQMMSAVAPEYMKYDSEALEERRRIAFERALYVYQ
ncbi:280331c7-0394-4808-86f3-eaa6ff2467d4-CDS [Sclerotinia trifoliorum]|uniref:280331c7-0394-4808-86f3-eaa6ff2467d4-CDS n=1 Tax=Sclerotinia trifoliorum TaxID=28548 RepID=A0A8H2ZST4_9HELO|nr:280331c7-0394-4808-86f3-eaa6ff2467d4-CDS [Sclerotinia trifoliorum]